MEEVNYYSLAKEDYEYFMDCYTANIKRNAMAPLAQNTCERFLKHIIELYCETKTVSIMHSHRLKVLLNYLKQELTDFIIDEELVLKADNFYYSTRYPGDDSFFASISDIDNCKLALDETKRVVDRYCTMHPIKTQKMNLFNDLPNLS